MDSVDVVVVDVFAEETLQVLLVQDNHVIQQLTASAADPSRGDSVLPGASKGRPPRRDTNLLDRLRDLV